MFILVSSLVVWAALLTISRALLLTTGMDPWAFTFIQMLSGGVTLMIFAWRPGLSWRAAGRPLTWLFGLSRVTSAACFTAALIYVSLVEASLLGLISVTGAALLAWRLGGARPGGMGSPTTGSGERRDFAGALVEDGGATRPSF